MKLEKSKRIAIALAAALAIPALVSGCGKHDSDTVANNQAPVILPPPPLPPPPPPGGVVPVPSGTCIPLTGQIAFAGSGIYFDSANVVGGRIPRTGQAVGQVVLGGGIGAPGETYQRSGVDGTISMQVSAVTGNPQYQPYSGYNQNYYPGQYNYQPNYQYQGPSQRSVQGIIQISPQTLNDIQYQAGGGYGNQWGGYNAYNQQYPQFPGSFPVQGYNTPYGQQPVGMPVPHQPACVSAIAFDLGHAYIQGQNVLFGGNVYLYLNNSDHGYALYF